MSEERSVRETVREGGGGRKRGKERWRNKWKERGRGRMRKGLMERGRDGMSLRAEPLETS